MDCANLIERHTGYLAEGFSCEPLPDGNVLVITPYQLPDGDLIEIQVEDRGGGRVRVSDLGETFASLMVQGFDPMGSDKRDWLLKQAVRLGDVELNEGELRKEGSSEDVGRVLLDVVTAIRAVSDLIYLHRSQEPQDFDARVITFLSDHTVGVEPKTTVRGLSGHSYRLTAKVLRQEHPPLLLSTLSPRSKGQVKAAVDRTVRQWVDIDGSMPREQKVSFLNDASVQWAKSDVLLLSKLSVVGTWSDRQQLAEFVSGNREPTDGSFDRPLWGQGDPEQ